MWVFEVLGFTLGVVEGDIVVEKGAVEVDLGRLLLEDGEHDVGGGARGGTRHFLRSRRELDSNR